ncbi:MAG TPA: TrmH family RNA methyltransferase [Candidatus Limnocylindria bacterium]|nr:TrmH family RNA methyltransferase [Candidatus Limnocylindria bacterium]
MGAVHGTARRIDDPGDPRLDAYRVRSDPALRRADQFVAEGSLVVRRLLGGGRHRVSSILATEAALDALGDALAAAAAVPEILVADAALLRAVAGYPFHRGCLALAERGPVPPLGTVLDALAPGPALTLVLDDVLNPDNVGALFRNAAAFGVGAVALTARSGDPCYRKAIRVSMGESLRIPWARFADWSEAGAALRARGIEAVALTPDGDDLDAVAERLPHRMALVVGNEGAGLSPAARGASVAAVGIPTRESLNVAAAAAIALYRLAPGRAARPDSAGRYSA